MISAPSANFDARTGPPDMLILHYTGMTSGEAALARLRDPAAKVSAHYMVEEDGRVFALVDEARRAWHAGVSSWQGSTDINTRAIGIEVVNPGHEFGYRPFPARQIDALVALLGDIRSRWTICDKAILAHSDVAPGRRQDPGELFPWETLAAAGHGLWVTPRDAPGEAIAPGDEGSPVAFLQNAFSRLGFNCPTTSRFDSSTQDVVVAFQRHWVQTRTDGHADGATRARLMALLRLAREAA